MKCHIILLFYCAVFGQTWNSVDCIDILEYMNTKLIEFSKSIVAMFENIKNVKNIFSERDEPVRLKIPQITLEKRLKESFDEFVRAAASVHDPDLTDLRSDPAALMSTPQLANLHRRKIISYVITTKDGYLLTLHRLYNTSNIDKNARSDNAVLLSHGIFGSSADWILLGPNKSLPYILNDAGYDVWMTNARGNYYSRGHVWKSVNSSDYWKFTFQEMGEYDLPAIIDFIREKNNQTGKINYIGHSMGATALLVLLSTKPSYNEYLRIGILLAPLAFMTNIRGPLRLFTSMSIKPPNHFLRVIGDTECFPSRKIPKLIASSLCCGSNIYCRNPLFFLAGNIRVNNTLDAGFMTRLLYHVPAGGSTNSIMHYGQLVQNGKFHRFGKGSSEFSLDQVKIPVALIASNNDWLATVPDVMRLYFSIANPIEHIVIRNKNFSHTEFVWGVNADKLVFKKILKLLKRDPKIEDKES